MDRLRSKAPLRAFSLLLLAKMIGAADRLPFLSTSEPVPYSTGTRLSRGTLADQKKPSDLHHGMNMNERGTNAPDAQLSSSPISAQAPHSSLLRLDLPPHAACLPLEYQ